MDTIILENKMEGWSFTLRDDFIHWTYDRLFDGQTHERSWGEASFELNAFKQFLIEFSQKKVSHLKAINGGELVSKRIPTGKIEIVVHVDEGDGLISIIDETTLSALINKL